MFNKLHTQLKSDLEKAGIPKDFLLVIKPFSKRYDGRYNPNTRRVIIYRYEDKEGRVEKPYLELLETLIHESVHHYQWAHDINFNRVKGVMHNKDFNCLFDTWLNKTKEAFNDSEN